MSYETEEQQVERLKEWWKENGTPLVIGAALGLTGFLGWKYWEHKQVAYQEAASDLYVKVSDILETEKKEGLAESAEAVKSQYPKSSYAILSAFQLAKLAVENKSLDKAKSELNWVINNHKNNELATTAKIRLARILIEQEKFTEALPLLEMESESGYYALANMVKGNALIAMGKNEEALAAYKIASADKGIIARNPTLKIKVDELTAEKVGSSKTIAADTVSLSASSAEGELDSVVRETETHVEQKEVEKVIKEKSEDVK